MATTLAPACAARMAALPEPAATSRTRSPGRIPQASTRTAPRSPTTRRPPCGSHPRPTSPDGGPSMSKDTPGNPGVSWPDPAEADRLVRRMQVKLHHPDCPSARLRRRAADTAPVAAKAQSGRISSHRYRVSDT
jgi:hypothetical protein